MKIRKSNSVILAILLLIQSMMLSVYAEQGAEPSKPVSGDGYMLFKSLNLLPENSGYMENDTITRAEFAYMIAKLVGYAGTESVNGSNFEDVDEQLQYSDVIVYLENLDIVNGFLDTFRPEDNITYEEAGTMAVKALGYYPLAVQMYGEYPECIRKMMSRIKLNDGISAAFDSEIKAKDVFVLLKNIAETPVFTATGFGTQVTAEADRDNTLLKEYYNIVKSRGRMTANGITVLGDTADTTYDAVIDGMRLKISPDFSGTAELLGENVDFWYDEEDSVLVYASPRAKDTEKLTISYYNLFTSDPGFSASDIVYKNDNGVRKHARISPTAYVVYNEVIYPYYTGEDFKLDNGKMELLDTDGDSRYDIVKITQHDDYIIKSVDYTRGQLHAENFALELENWDRVIVKNNGIVTDSIADIKINTPVSISMSKDGKSVITIENCAQKTFSATLDSIGQDDENTMLLTIGGKEYKAARSLAAKLSSEGGKKAEPGVKYEFYMNSDGDIMDFSASVASGEWYDGYCLGMQQVDDIEYGVLVRILMPDKTFLRVYLNEKFSLNGKTITEDQALNSEIFFDFVTDEQNEGMNKRIPKRLPVKFKLNDREKISAIKTANNIINKDYIYDTEEFTLNLYYASAQYKGDVNGILSSYFINDNTLIIQDEHLSDGKPNYDVEDITFMTKNDLKSYGLLENCYVYNLDQNMQAGIVVFESGDAEVGSDSEWESFYLTVDKVIKTLDEDDEIVYKIRGVFYGTMREFEPYDDETLDLSKFKRGDVCRLSMKQNKINKMELVCSLSEQKKSEYFEGEAIENSISSSLYAPIFSVNSSGVVVVAPEAASPSGILYKLIGNAYNQTPVTIYNRADNTVTAGKWSDIYANVIPDSRGNVSVTDKTNRIFIHRRWGYARDVVFVTD